MLMLYWEIGGVLAERQKIEGWGTAVLPRLATDLQNDLPEVKGFSVRNLKLMTQFFREYPDFSAIGQPPAAQLTWAHNIILIQKVKDLPTRLWYARQAFEHGWSRDVLSLQIQSRAHERHGKAVTNFQRTLPLPQSDLASQLLKDPYFFDFLTLEKPFHERELETGLLRHLQDFLVELGTGFAFVGRQIHMEVGKDDFYIDLLFYHLNALRKCVPVNSSIGTVIPNEPKMLTSATRERSIVRWPTLAVSTISLISHKATFHAGLRSA
jgi:predicted nuclease of restriction endonuclease-like (RecB) superfamily